MIAVLLSQCQMLPFIEGQKTRRDFTNRRWGQTLTARYLRADYTYNVLAYHKGHGGGA